VLKTYYDGWKQLKKVSESFPFLVPSLKGNWLLCEEAVLKATLL